MRVRATANLDARPPMLLDGHPRTMDGDEVGGEVTGQAERKLLALADRSFLRECEHGVLLCIRGHHLAVVSNKVTKTKVTNKNNTNHQVLDSVGLAVSAHPNQVRVALA